MFTQRYAIDQNKQVIAELAANINRKLSVTVQKLIARRAPEPALVPSECENGVCSLSWKPNRPAA